jgi:hypothetical protein
MKPVLLVNPRTNERYICENIRDVKIIEGVVYIEVHRENSPRLHLMRRDALVKVTKQTQ